MTSASATPLSAMPHGILPPHPGLALKETPRGLALYTRTGHRAGDTLLEHYGPRASFEAGERIAPDHVMEIGDNEVFLPSGALDDYVNHSCDPNCRLDFRAGDKVFLVALRDIAPGEELSFDYATTTTRAGIEAFPGWRFACLCGVPQCRGEVGCAEDLPPEKLRFYAEAGALAPHVKKRLELTPERAADQRGGSEGPAAKAGIAPRK
ncbi:MAG TPA: SET domain-containing protein-lysine N-methyltransferase [Burkholderiales bacterium]|nr:SET domain-containing protein-lysine N-methyltransferase [Burkholderiales bacterium]